MRYLPPPTIHKNTTDNKCCRVWRNQNPPTFSSGNVKWERLGHRTPRSFLQNLNRSYHGIWPFQCWDSARSTKKDNYTHPSVHCTNIYHRPRLYAHLESFSEMVISMWDTHTSIYTHMHWHKKHAVCSK